MDGVTTAAAVDAGVLECKCAEELVEHLTQANDDPPKRNPGRQTFTDVLRQLELTAGDDGRGTADLDALEPLGRALHPRIQG
jgi:hypothetical protein